MLLALALLLADAAAVGEAFLAMREAPAGAAEAVVRLFADALPEKAERRWEDEGAEIWRRRLKRGEWAFVLRNRGRRAVSIDVIWKEHGLKGSPRVDEVVRGEARGKVHGGFAERVEPGGWVVLRVRP